MIRSRAARWLQAVERLGLTARLVLAWLFCAIPRVAFTLITGPAEDYRYFQGMPFHSYWYPLYTLIAHSFWTISRGSLPVYVGLHLVIHSLIGPAVYLLARQLRFSPAGAWCSVVGAALLPYYVSIAGRQSNVGIVIVLFAVLLVGFVLWVNRGLSLFPGCLFAALAFLILPIRPNALSVVAFLYTLALFVALQQRGEASPGALRRGLARVALSGVTFLALVGGLAWGNLRTTGHFTPFTPNSGYNLYVGNNPDVPSYVRRHDIMSLESAIFDHGLPGEVTAEADPYERDRMLARLAAGYIAANPRQTLDNALMKTLRYWDYRMERAAELPWLWNAGLAVPYFVYGSLAVFGSWLMWRRGRRFALAVLGGSLVFYWLPHLVYFGSIRMRMTSEFLLLMLAAYALAPSAEDGPPVTPV